MKARFLCAPHRMEMINNPARAMSFWYSSFDTAQELCDQKLYKEALPYLGCAFETADIILSSETSETRHAYELFARSAILFAATCARISYKQDALEIYWMAIYRLERGLSIDREDKNCINKLLTYFYESVQGQDYLGNTSDLAFIFERSPQNTAIQ